MPLKWRLCSKKIKDVKLAITLQVSWAVPRHWALRLREQMDLVACCAPCHYFCFVLWFQSFHLCCHFSGSSWSLTIKPKVDAETWLYTNDNCIFHKLFVLARLSLSKARSWFIFIQFCKKDRCINVHSPSPSYWKTYFPPREIQEFQQKKCKASDKQNNNNNGMRIDQLETGPLSQKGHKRPVTFLKCKYCWFFFSPGIKFSCCWGNSPQWKH